MLARSLSIVLGLVLSLSFFADRAFADENADHLGIQSICEATFFSVENLLIVQCNSSNFNIVESNGRALTFIYSNEFGGPSFSYTAALEVGPVEAMATSSIEDVFGCPGVERCVFQLPEQAAIEIDVLSGDFFLENTIFYEASGRILFLPDTSPGLVILEWNRLLPSEIRHFTFVQIGNYGA